MRRSVRSTIVPAVFWVSSSISKLFVVWGVFFTESLSAALQQTGSLERESGG